MKQIISLTEADIGNIVREAVIDMYESGQLDESKLKNAMLGIMMGGTSLMMMNGHHQYRANHAHRDNRPKTELNQTRNDDSLQKAFDPYEYHPSEKIINKIKEFEGWHGGFDENHRPLPGWQDDGKGFMTTGWGFKATPQLKRRYPNGMTVEEANDYMVMVAIPERVKQFNDIMGKMPLLHYYTQEQLDALFDLLYNIGARQFKEKSPKLMKALHNYDFGNIVANLDHDYNNRKLPGAKKRRDYERSFFM